MGSDLSSEILPNPLSVFITNLSLRPAPPPTPSSPALPPGAIALERVYLSQGLAYRSSLHQACEVAVEVWCEHIQVKGINECFQVVSHFLNSEKKDKD